MRHVKPVLLVSSLLCATASASLAANSTAKSVVNDVSVKRIESYVRALAGFGTRHTLSETEHPTRGIGAARRWIAAELERCAKDSGGRLQVALDEFVAEPSARVPTPTTIVNVVATLPGTQPESRDRVYVVAGHYDSRVSDVMNATSDAPGANDDASGTAAVMELACVMSKRPFDATLVFMAVAGEEQGLIGSTHWAKQARARGMNIAGMITNDIIGGARDADGKSYRNRVRLFAEGVPPINTLDNDLRTRISTGGENDSPTRQLARFIKAQGERYARGMRVDLVYRRDRYLRGGDHLPFLEQGYPAVRFTEARENFRQQHQDLRVENGVRYGDLIEFVDFDYVANVTRVNGAALAALANGPAAPANAAIETIELENDTTLRWDANKEPDIAGYRVVWRETTAPFWQHRRDAGNVTRYTLKGVSKDDFVFGVVAIDKDGNESVASYPAPFRPTR